LSYLHVIVLATCPAVISTLSLHDALPISFRAPAPPAVERTPSDNVVKAFAFMSGNERRIDAQEFRGGNLGAVMGGVELDLRGARSEEHTSELQSRENLVCRLLLEKKKTTK